MGLISKPRSTRTEATYSIVRKFKDHDSEVIAKGVTFEEARAWCRDPETSSSTCSKREGLELTLKKGPWFDVYYCE